MHIKFIFKKSLIFLVLIAGLMAGMLGTGTYASIRNQSLAQAPQYPKNETGKTYGSALKATSQETEPDLIKAIGEDGTIGYVRKTDINEELPKSPEEALKNQNEEKSVKQVPLYDVDGKKIIGKFKIDPGVSTMERETVN